MSSKESQDQEVIVFTKEQTEAIRQGFEGLEAGKKGHTLEEARASATKRAQEWLTKNAGHGASA